MKKKRGKKVRKAKRRTARPTARKRVVTRTSTTTVRVVESNPAGARPARRHRHSDNLGRCLYEDGNGTLRCAYEEFRKPSGWSTVPRDPRSTPLRPRALRGRR